MAYTIPVSVTGRTADWYAGGGPGRLMGYAAREASTSAAAILQVLDGQDVNAPLVLPVSLSASESTRDWFGPDGIVLLAGPFLHVVSGTVDFVFYVAFDSDPRNQQ